MENRLQSQLALRIERSDPIRKLSGWRKTYRLPDRCSPESTAFVARCTKEEIQADLDHYFALLRSAFGFSRRELTTDDSEDGVGFIVTPLFAYSIQAQLSPDELDMVLWTRVVDGIQSRETLATPAFAKVFDQVFNTVQLAFPKPIQIESFIDAVEDAKSEAFSLEYDREATYCELAMLGHNSKIRVCPTGLSIVHQGLCTTQALLSSLESIQLFIQKHTDPAVPMNPGPI